MSELEKMEQRVAELEEKTGVLVEVVNTLVEAVCGSEFTKKLDKLAGYGSKE